MGVYFAGQRERFSNFELEFCFLAALLQQVLVISMLLTAKYVSEDETFCVGDSIVGKSLGGWWEWGSLVQATTKLRPHYDRGQHFQPFYSTNNYPNSSTHSAKNL